MNVQLEVGPDPNIGPEHVGVLGPGFREEALVPVQLTGTVSSQSFFWEGEE